MIRDLFLDLDDTVLDFGRAEREALKGALSGLGIEAGDDVAKRYSEINLAQWKRLERGEVSRAEMKEERFRLLFAELGKEADPAEAAMLYEEGLKRGSWFMDGALEAIRSLRGMCRLYVASNGTAAVQAARIKNAGIAELFDGIFISEEIGVNKPDAGFFDFCFAQIDGFSKKTAAIAGDSLTSDVLGGKNAGITTIWLSRGRDCRGGAAPDHIIGGIRELPALIAEI